MPAKTQKQKDFFKLVKAYKSNAIKGTEVSDAVKKAAEGMSIKQIDDFLTLQEDFDSYVKEQMELDESSAKKYGRNKLFNIQAMKDIIETSKFLTNQYDKLKDRGKEIFGYHYNEIILSFIFLKYIKSNKELFKKYLSLRSNVVKDKELEDNKLKSLELGLETEPTEEIDKTEKDENELEETTSFGTFGVGGMPSTPFAFAKNKNNFKNKEGFTPIKRTIQEELDPNSNDITIIEYNGNDLNGEVPNDLFDGNDITLKFVTDLNDDINTIIIPIDELIDMISKEDGDKETRIDFIKNVELQEPGDLTNILINYIKTNLDKITTENNVMTEQDLSSNDEIKNYILDNSDLYTEDELNDMDFDTLHKAYIDVESDSHFINQTKDELLKGNEIMNEENKTHKLQVKGTTIGEFLLNAMDNSSIWNFITSDEFKANDSIETEDGLTFNQKELEEFLKTIEDVTTDTENSVNEEMKHPALVNLDRVHAETAKNEKEYFNTLNKGVQKEVEKPEDGGTFEYDYAKDSMKKEDVPKYTPTTEVDKFVELNRGRGAEDIDFDIEPSKAYLDRMKASIGEEKYNAMIEKAKLRALERRNERDVETQINTNEKSKQISTMLNPGLNETKLTGRYLDIIKGSNAFVTFKVKEFILTENVDKTWKEVDFKGLGNKYSSLISEQKFVDNGVNEFINENKFYLDNKENKMYYINSKVDNKIDKKIIDQIKESTNFKFKK